MNLIRTFLSIAILIPLIVISSGGFNVFIHHCNETGNNIFSFQEPQECEHDHNITHQCEKDCQTLKNHFSKGNCCENSHQFIKTIDNISNYICNFELNSKIIYANHLILDNFDLEQQHYLISKEYSDFDYKAPPDRDAKFVLIKNGTLKIDCCNI